MKKKNLLKCLALTSMLALSVGAVTSCGTQGEAGKDGAQGAQGAQGPQGEQGEQGEKGDTSYEVIVLPSVAGTISLKDGESYTGIKGDTRTLVFTPKTEGQFVISLSINYEEVELTDEILNGSLALTFSDQSYIVSATFGDITTYADTLLDDYYKALVAKDSQLDPAGSTTFGDTGAVERSDFGDSTLESSTLVNQKTAVGKVIAAFKTTDTTKEKVDAVRTAVATAEKAIDTAYATLITAAKTLANTKLTTLYETEMAVSTLGYIKENRVAFEAAAKKEVEAATTLAGLSDIIDSASVGKNKYGELEAYRKAAMVAINKKIASIELSDPAFASDSDDNAALVATLKEYGITELPETIAEAQLKNLSAQASFTESDDDDTVTGSVEGDAAYKAVKDSYDGIISALKTAIRAAYDKEIYASKVVVETKDRDNVSSIVGTAIAEWCEANKDSLKISGMLSYMYDSTVNLVYNGETTTNPSGSTGLLGYIESQLTVDANGSLISTAFVNERLGNAVAKQAAVLKAALDGYLEDSQYKKAVTSITSDAYTALTDADKATKYTSKTIGTKTYYYLTKIGPTSNEVANAIGGEVAKDVQVIYDEDVLKTSSTGLYSKSDVLAINTYAKGQLTVYSTAYKAALADYKAKQYVVQDAKVTATTLQAETVAEFKAVIDDSKNPVTTLDGINALIPSLSVWDKCFKELNTKFEDFVTTKNDTVLTKAVDDEDATNELYKSYLDERDAIIAGTVTTTDQVDAWADGLKALYTAGVSASLAKYKEIFDNSYKAYLKGASGTVAASVKDAYDSFVKLAATEDFPCDTFSSVLSWYNTGIRRLNVASDPTNAYATPVAAASGISGTQDNSGNIDVKAKDADSKYDAGIEISLKDSKTLTAESDVTNAGFNANYAAADGYLYIIAFNINGAQRYETAGDATTNFTDAGFLTLPNKMAENGIKTVSGSTLKNDSTWYNICLAVDGSAKDFVIEYSFDGITTYRVHVVIKAGLVG